jgi:hypothetical protein
MAIQEFFTSRNNGIDDPAEFVGKEGRLWYDPDTNTIKVYDGNEGGQTVGGGGGGNGSPGGANTYVQFNRNGDFGASANFTFNSSTNILTVNGSANLGNLVTANFFSGTLTTSAQPNITSVGTLTSLAVTGNTITGNLKLNGGLTTNRSNVAVLPSTFSIIDQFTPSSYRTAKYIISAAGDNGYQSVEAILVHDGLDSYITVYGSVCSNITADIVDITSNINGISGNVAVYASTVSGNTKVNLVAAYILPTY